MQHTNYVLEGHNRARRSEQEFRVAKRDLTSICIGDLREVGVAEERDISDFHCPPDNVGN